jgi:hypothetical protein
MRRRQPALPCRSAKVNQPKSISQSQSWWTPGWRAEHADVSQSVNQRSTDRNHSSNTPAPKDRPKTPATFGRDPPPVPGPCIPNSPLKRTTPTACKSRCNAASHAESGPRRPQGEQEASRPALLAVRLAREHAVEARPKQSGATSPTTFRPAALRLPVPWHARLLSDLQGSVVKLQDANDSSRVVDGQCRISLSLRAELPQHATD